MVRVEIPGELAVAAGLAPDNLSAQATRLLALELYREDRVSLGRAAGLAIMGCLGALEAGTRRGLVPDLRQAYTDLLRHGIRFDIRLLQDSLARLGLPSL